MSRQRTPKEKEVRALITEIGHKTYNVYTDKCDKHFLTGYIIDRNSDTDDCDDEFANTHANCTDKKEPTTTKTLDTPHPG